MDGKREKLIIGDYLSGEDKHSSARLGFILGIIVACVILVGQLALQIISVVLSKGTNIYEPSWMGIASIFIPLFLGKGGQKWIELHSTKINTK